MTQAKLTQIEHEIANDVPGKDVRTPPETLAGEPLRDGHRTVGSGAHGIVQRPFYKLIGLFVVEAAGGASLVRLDATEDTANSRGEVHAGALATMLDAALVNAARSLLPEGSGAATVNLSVNYLAPGRGALTARGRVVRVGRSLVSAEASITDAAGAVVAQAIGTLRVIMPKA